MFEPELFRRAHVEALIRGDGELLPEAGAAQLRLWFCPGVTAVYLLGNVSLMQRKVTKSGMFNSCDTTQRCYKDCTARQSVEHLHPVAGQEVDADAGVGSAVEQERHIVLVRLPRHRH